ncbi:MAG: transketolase [Chitinivibrionales bacterium]|nr:transketolase [Chitinivibrionales bacterium]MBD3355524.1 transketolase [Chitinivibrionales bacterium]
MAKLKVLARRVRHLILEASSSAGSGHPTSALSATDLAIGLLFGGTFRYDTERPSLPNNDRFIFSKGHASPLFYGMWAAAGKLTEEDMKTYRRFDSPLEGHPTAAFRYVDAATGSLGQGLSIGVGMALSAKYLEELPFRTFVLLGDGEMAEGSQWEAIQIAAHYKLDKLIGILDVNRLGQRGETMYGYDLEAYRSRIDAFGWNTITIDGHSFPEILDAYRSAAGTSGRPTMIIAKTVKGKGVSFLEDRNGWHGKALDSEKLQKAFEELGDIDRNARGSITPPEDIRPRAIAASTPSSVNYEPGESIPTRDAFGRALTRIYPRFPQIVSLDGEVSNSTRSAYFAKEYPHRFFEMYIAEQNMVGTALGMSCRGMIPFVSTFAAFLTRAFDQIRMARHSDPNIKFVGSHAGVSIGADGPSQMGLEDIAMFRVIPNSVVLYPCDAVSTEKLVEAAAAHEGIAYLRTTRNATPVIYGGNDAFRIGGSKILKQSTNDRITVIGAGVTLHEALAAYEDLRSENIVVRVIDLYSVKPLDRETLREAARVTDALLTVEDHYPEGGIGEAVGEAVADCPAPVFTLAVRQRPKSGKPRELLNYESISREAIIRKVKAIVERGNR